MNTRKIVFFTGILLAIISAILLVGNFTGESRVPIVLGIAGIVMIGFSGYRLLHGGT